MDIFSSCLGILDDRYKERQATLMQIAIEKLSECHIDDIRNVTHNSILYNHKCTGPVTFHAILRKFSNRKECKTYKELLRVIGRSHQSCYLKTYAYIIITVSNTCICIKNDETYAPIRPLVAIFDCNQIIRETP